MFSAEALEQIISSGGVWYRKTATSFIFDCPLCNKRAKLWLYKHSGYFRCWVCQSDGFQGAAEKALVALYGGNFQDYQKLLRGGEAEHMGFLDFDFGLEEDNDVVDDRETGFLGWEWSPMAVEADDPRFERARVYLASRGIGDDVIKKYGIRYLPGENRVLFPYVMQGELVGWQGRICGPNVIVDSLTGRSREIPKALTTIQGGIQSRYVMCAENLATSPHAVLAEGPITCYKLELCGGNVATLGKGVSEAQLRWLGERVKRIYLALDVDAVTDIERIAQQLVGMGIETWVMRVPEHVQERLEAVNPDAEADFGDCTPEEALQAFRDAHRWIPGQLIIRMGSRLYC